MMGKRMLRASALVAAVIVASCSTSTQAEDGAPVESQPEAEIPHSYRWSADPSVDIFSRGAELVRATYEAGGLAFFRGIDHSFPGYRTAIGGPVGHLDPDIMESVGSVAPIGDPLPTTNFRHIADFHSGDRSVGATVCTYELFANERDNTLEPRLGQTRIELENTGNSPGAPGEPDLHPDQEDPDAQSPPDWDVFGDWKIIRFETIPDAPRECTGWWLSQFPTLPTNPETGRISIPDDFRAPTVPVAVQYPEWIGPARNE